MHIASAPVRNIFAGFAISGNLRFLSHAETIRMFQYACNRAGLKIAHSQGFNPRPKISLPLPRSVGVETEDDMLALRVENLLLSDAEAGEKLNEQLPDGCRITNVESAESGKFQPVTADYLFAIKAEFQDEIKEAAEEYQRSDDIVINRRTKSGKPRQLNARDYIETIKINENELTVRCVITNAGALRIEEIQNIFKIQLHMLAGPVKRKSVQWRLA